MSVLIRSEINGKPYHAMVRKELSDRSVSISIHTLINRWVSQAQGIIQYDHVCLLKR